MPTRDGLEYFADYARWVDFINTTSETVPPHAAMRVIEVTIRDGRPVLRVAKPNDCVQQTIVFNDSLPVHPSAYGICTHGDRFYARYNTSDGTPANAEFWSVVANSWELGLTADHNYVCVGETATAPFAMFHVPLRNELIFARATVDIAKGNSGFIQLISENSGELVLAVSRLMDVVEEELVYAKKIDCDYHIIASEEPPIEGDSAEGFSAPDSAGSAEKCDGNLCPPEPDGDCPPGTQKAWLNMSPPEGCTDCGGSAPSAPSGAAEECKFICIPNNMIGVCGDASAGAALVQTDCCLNALPQTLVATFSAASGACTCANNDTIVLTYNSFTKRWVGTSQFCTGENVTIEFFCATVGVFNMVVSFSAACVSDQLLSASSSVCNPLSVVFSATIDDSCCGEAAAPSTITVTVTE